MPAANQPPMVSPHSARSAKVEAVFRLLLGALLAFASLNFWFHFAPEPEMPAPAQAFFGALAQTGYFLPLLKATELMVAIAVLSNRFLPLALVVLAPITVNIVLFHVVLAPGEIPGALVLLALHLALAWSRRASFAELLKSR